MGKSLFDLMNDDNMSSLDATKTASQESPASVNEIDSEIDKLAMEMGIDLSEPSAVKTASEDEDEDDKDEKDEKDEDEGSDKTAAENKEGEGDDKPAPSEDKNEDEGAKKEANMSLESMFNELYPEDASLSKTASELEKEAAEEVIGARAFDFFGERFNSRVTKLAMEHGSAKAQSLKASEGSKGIGEDASKPQELENDASSKDQNAIGTDPRATGEEAANSAERNNATSVGDFSGDKLAGAMRKAFLKDTLGTK